MNWDRFIARVDRLWAQAPQSRYGQILLNELYLQRPVLADSLRGGDNDPYYKHSPEDCRDIVAYILDRY